MSQPALHNLPCSECSKFIYEATNGWAPLMRNGKKVPRGRTLPPCPTCPKKSPAESHEFELSRSNRQAVAHFLRHRAMNFQALTEAEKLDPIVQENFVIIDDEFRRHEKQAHFGDLMLILQSATASTIAAAKPGGRPRG